MIDTSRQEIELLLPWYVTGKLSATEKKLVEHGLKQFPDLRHALDLIEDEWRATQNVNEAAELPRSLRAANLMDKLGLKDEAPQREFGRASARQAIAWLFASPLRGAAVAAMLLLFFGQAAVIGKLVMDRQGEDYITASGPHRTVGALVLVRFAPGAKLDDVTAILTAHGFTVVDGPKAGGFYTVRIGESTLTDSTRQDAMKELESQSAIIADVLPSR